MAGEPARVSPLRLGTYHMANDNTFEPQRTNNFELQITGLGDDGQTITLAVSDFTAPSIELGDLTVSYGNNKIHYAGVPNFTGGSVTFNDFIGQRVEKILSDWQKLTYDYSTQKIGWATDYKKVGYIIEYDPSGGSARSWQLVGCWLQQLQLGQFTQDNQLRKISCNIIYDYAIPETYGSTMQPYNSIY